MFLYPRLERGHYGVSFPHICPGPDCAIARWILSRLAQEAAR